MCEWKCAPSLAVTPSCAFDSCDLSWRCDFKIETKRYFLRRWRSTRMTVRMSWQILWRRRLGMEAPFEEREIVWPGRSLPAHLQLFFKQCEDGQMSLNFWQEIAQTVGRDWFATVEEKKQSCWERGRSPYCFNAQMASRNTFRFLTHTCGMHLRMKTSNGSEQNCVHIHCCSRPCLAWTMIKALVELEFLSN